MRWKPPRARPRRGAWRGSQQAKAGAAACLVAALLTLAAPGPASAYRCEDAVRSSTPAPYLEAHGRAMFSAPANTECPFPADEQRGSGRPKKRGSMSGLTVFVLAIAAVLLIPIGARGIPASADPYREDPFTY